MLIKGGAYVLSLIHIWCISRQRTWGVPIPIFFCKDCGKEYITDESISAVAELFRTEGSDAWYEKAASEILPAGAVCRCV